MGWRITLLVAVCGAIVGCGAVGVPGGNRPANANQAKRTYTREEFTKLVVGRTTDEVLKAAGKPDSTQDFGTVMWYYHGRTVDPVSGKVDHTAQLVFKGGVVERVNY